MFAVPLAKAALLGGVARTPAHILGFNLKVWHDNQDLSTMFADFAMTPATIGLAVALQWDKAKHGFGGEIRSTGVPALTGTATAATYNTSTGVGTATRPDSSNYSFVDFTGDTIGRPYLVDVENTGAAAFSVRDGVSVMANINAGQRKTVFVQAIATSVRILPDVNGTSIAFTVHSVKEVLGTPRYQATSAQRPILGRHPKGGRRNLLTYTENFSNAAWTSTGWTITPNDAAAPDGTMTGTKVTSVSAANVLTRAVTATSTSYTFAVIAKPGTASAAAIQLRNSTTATNLSNIRLDGSSVIGSATRTALADGWYLYVVKASTGITIGDSLTLYWGATGAITAGQYFHILNAQLETGSTATAYQKVTSTYDCTEAGVPDVYYLQADGSDDGMVTPALDLSYTDKIGVFAAVRKLSDAARAMIVEFGNSSFQAFRLEGPANIGDIEYAFASAGSSAAFAGYDNSAGAAPNTSVLTGLGNISGDSAVLRVNGAQVASSATDQGTGNYGNYALYFFRRGGATVPFNGLEYGFALCDTTPSAAQIAAMETHYNNIVGVY